MSAAVVKNSLLALALAAAVCATPALAEEKPSGAEGATIEVEGTVTAVDLDAREVTIKRTDGEEVVLEVGPEARNLDQVEVGDTVSASYFQGLLFYVEPAGGGKPMRVVTTEAQRAPKGAKPSGAVTQWVELVARVEGIDAKARTVTLRGPHALVTLQVADDIDLSTVKLNDLVRAEFVEHFAVDVTEK